MGELNSVKLLKKGAEAILYTAYWHDRKAILKKRLPKKYRQEELDYRIRNYRTVHEPLLMHEAKKAGVLTPMIFQVDTKNSLIIMEFIPGTSVKAVLGIVTQKERTELCVTIGMLIGRLHESGLIHGDLTTSNMILDDAGRIVLIDFGLGEKNVEFEARGVDLHLMKRALQSTHYRFAHECFENVISGYRMVLGKKDAESVLEKIIEIEKRGRYVEERRQDEQKNI